MVSVSNEELLKACFDCAEEFHRFKRRQYFEKVNKAMDLLRLQMKNEYERNRQTDK